jgi:hypothetical protein
MTLHVRVQVEVKLLEDGSGMYDIALQANVLGMEPKRWAVPGLVNEADLMNTYAVLDILKSELRGLTLEEYQKIPSHTRALSVSQLATDVSNIRSRIRQEI